jgi:FkbM family methyltransferase
VVEFADPIICNLGVIEGKPPPRVISICATKKVVGSSCVDMSHFNAAMASGPLRWPLAIVVGSAVVSKRHREPCLVTPTEGGLLAHRYRRGAFPFSGLDGPTANYYRWQAFNSFFWQYIPKMGDVVVDVGAGIGEEALTASRLVGPTGRVICIEAQPTTFNRLCLTCKLNRLTNVTTLNLAVSDRVGIARIQTDGPYEEAALTERGGAEVPTETLDGILHDREVHAIDLLKMNIEGAERLAIRGMETTIAGTHNVVISCHDFLLERGLDPSEVATFDRISMFLKDHGFELTTRLDDPLPWNRFNVYGRRTLSLV